MKTPIETLFLAMMEHEARDAARIQHFTKVYEYASLIGKEENLAEDLQETLEAAAILHDIGIHPSEVKYGSADGKHQEQEGPALAVRLLSALGWEEERVKRVAYLVGHHHTYDGIDGMDYQILVEADFLVNLFEDHSSRETQREVYRRIFRTEGGKRLFRTMFDPGPKRLIYGTGNPAKVEVMRHCLAGLGIEIIGLEELRSMLEGQSAVSLRDGASAADPQQGRRILAAEIPSVEEDGKTPLENARKKALCYYRAFHRPVFSCDSGLYIDGIPEEEQPGIHVRTIKGKYLNDEEMVAHYTGLAAQYGDLKAQYRNAICLVLDEGHIYECMDSSLESEPFLLVSEARPIRKKGFPLDSLSVDIKTGKYYYDLEEAALDRVAVEDGFLEFFRKIQDEL